MPIRSPLLVPLCAPFLRAGAFETGDIIRSVGSAEGEWIKVCREGSIKSEDQAALRADDEAADASAAVVPRATHGWVRTCNRFRALVVCLTPGSAAESAADEAWAAQCAARAEAVHWLRALPASSAAAATAASRPLTKPLDLENDLSLTQVSKSTRWPKQVGASYLHCLKTAPEHHPRL